jgi:hypothetical protein
MRRFFLNKITATALLAYFVLFVVPPVSSFAASRLSTAEENGGLVIRSLGDGPGHTARFLLDIIVWQQFKKTEQSRLSAMFVKDVAASDPEYRRPNQVLTADVSLIDTSPALLGAGARAVSSHRVRSSLIIFSRSGCSPPAAFYY